MIAYAFRLNSRTTRVDVVQKIFLFLGEWHWVET